MDPFSSLTIATISQLLILRLSFQANVKSDWNESPLTGFEITVNPSCPVKLDLKDD